MLISYSTDKYNSIGTVVLIHPKAMYDLAWIKQKIITYKHNIY